MKELTKKILRSAGILCAIGAVGGLVIAGVNAWTSPIIAQNNAEKASATYKVIFPELTKVGDSVTVSGKYVSSYVIAYQGDTEIGRIYTGTASYGQTVNMKIMVGMSTANGKTVLGKVSILNNGATGGFDTTVVANYVTPYNAAPSETTLANVKCGATAAATAIKMIVSEAKDLFESGGTVEDIDGEIKTLFDTALSHSDAVDITGKTYATKYYAVYSDAEKTNYLGSAYRLSGSTSDGNAITLLGAISGGIAAPSYGKIVSVKSAVDLTSDLTSYNAAPSASQFDSWTNATAGALAKSMMAEAASAYAAGVGNLSSEGYMLQIYPTMKGASDAIALTGTTYVSKYYVAYSDAAKTAGTEIGHVYYGSGTSEGFEPYDGAGVHHSNITLMVGISGTTASPTLGKLVLLSDDSYDGAGMSGDYVSKYNDNPTADFDTISTGSTYSAKLIKGIIAEALVSYKGGK